MKKFIKSILFFVFPALIYAVFALTIMPHLNYFQNGPSTEEQISKSFENALKRKYELLILGNSRTYRGINPDMFEIKTYNFSHDNDSYNQIYYKLEYLVDHKKKIKYLLLGTDYFQFSFKADTRNYIYADLLHDNYMKDYDESKLFMQKMKYYVGKINPKKLFTYYPEKDRPFLRENGQFIKPGKATETDSISRKIKRLNLQITYFEKTINLCKAKQIKIIMVMPPSRRVEIKAYKDKDLKEFNNFIQKHTDNKNILYLNYSNLNGFETKDYTDFTHLNEKAANRFSKILNKDLIQLIVENKF